MYRIGIIGFGFRVSGLIETMKSLGRDFMVVAIMDANHELARKRISEKGLDAEKIRLYTDADEMLDKEDLDGVMIGTRCSLHTKYAVKVLSRNLPLFLEKPVATNLEDLMILRNAAENSSSQVVVSFPLRVTPLVQLAREIVDSGKLGTMEHVQAYNNVPYGGVYYQLWYRDENETQGLWLQKATHDFDYINYLLGVQPVTVCAMKSKQIYKGNHAADLCCKDCDEKSTCADSPYNPYLPHGFPEFEGMNWHLKCGFAVDSGNEDSGSAIVRYETGMHVAYSQNFFARQKAGSRGARLLGYKGTLEFDWYKDELKVFMHHTPRVETYKTDSAAMAHGGGDLVLSESFLNIMEGKCESVSPLSAGLLSALMCLKAKESSLTDTFQQIEWPDGKPAPKVWFEESR